LGASAHHEGEASINHLMVERAQRVIAVADSSKLGRRAFAQICPVDRVETLVTDTDADPAAVRAFEAAGVTVLTV
jgi:DeoR family transcriptional regulator of aga operon